MLLKMLTNCFSHTYNWCSRNSNSHKHSLYLKVEWLGTQHGTAYRAITATGLVNLHWEQWGRFTQEISTGKYPTRKSIKAKYPQVSMESLCLAANTGHIRHWMNVTARYSCSPDCNDNQVQVISILGNVSRVRILSVTMVREKRVKLWQYPLLQKEAGFDALTSEEGALMK